jgi:hypothetical protein
LNAEETLAGQAGVVVVVVVVVCFGSRANGFILHWPIEKREVGILHSGFACPRFLPRHSELDTSSVHSWNYSIPVMQEHFQGRNTYYTHTVITV